MSNKYRTAIEWESDMMLAMKAKQAQRAEEVGGHSYRETIKHYGLRIMFAEMATIMTRLERMIWQGNPEQAIDEKSARLLDLLVDLGNYAAFTYDHVRIEAMSRERDLRNSTNIGVSRRESGE